VIYKGPVGVEQLLEDLKRIDASPSLRRDLAVPFPGQWISPPSTSDPLQIAGALADSGCPELASRYAEQLIEYFTQGSASQYVSDTARSEKLAGLHAFRGSILLAQEKLEDATGAFQAALKLSPQDRGSHVQLGQAFTKLAKTDEAARHFQMALEIDDSDADTHYNLALGLTELGRHSEAVAHYGNVLRLRPGWPPAANNLAWILSTHPDASIRDGERAVELAEEVCRKVRYQDPTGLDTLAAAQAESGRMDAAIGTIRRAIELTESRNDKATVEKLKDRLRTYEAGRPYRDPKLRVSDL
jgi:tetratricopeptide (TPR) repeat protein